MLLLTAGIALQDDSGSTCGAHRWSPAEGSHAATLVDAKLLLADAACLGFAAKVAAASSCVRALVLLGDPSSYAEADLGSVSVPIIFTGES